MESANNHQEEDKEYSVNGENRIMKIDQGKKLRILLAIHLAVLQQMVGVNSVVAYGT